jgi:plasmid maintenance system antidote protein VapI
MTDPQAGAYWLDRVKIREGISSDYELAKRLSLSRPGVSQIRSGKTGIGIKTALTMGWILETDPLLIISNVLRDTEKSEEERQFWEAVHQERIKEAASVASSSEPAKAQD